MRSAALAPKTADPAMRPASARVPQPHRPVRPIDAASLVIVRGHGTGARVLMGRRRQASSFMPGWYVFPGGRVEPADAAPAPGPVLGAEATARLTARCRRVDPRALAVAAIRETYEETGLLVARPADAPNAVPPLTAGRFWRACHAARVTPDLGALAYIARAITPVSYPKRFNARFFLTTRVPENGDLSGDGELVDLRWVPLTDPGDLAIAGVTAFVLDRVRDHLRGQAPARVPVLCHVGGRQRLLAD